MKIVIDGGHRQAAAGTGVSIYSRMLGDAAISLGHEVAWLTGGDASSSDQQLTEIAELDRPEPARGLRQKLLTLRHMAEGLLSDSVRAVPVPATGLVLKPPGASAPGPKFAALRLFERAHYVHMLKRRFLNVELPDTPDLFHLSTPIPLRMKGVPTAVTIHDIVPMRAPYATPDNKREYLSRIRKNIAYADIIVTVSEASKRDLVEFLKVKEDRIHVTPLYSTLPTFSGSEDQLARALAKFGLEPDGYILYVGALEPKKNLGMLVDAYLESTADIPLILAGRRAWMFERDLGPALEKLGETARSKIRLLGYVPSSDLSALHAGARTFVFPSLIEGFGLPPLDAMAAGKPLLVSNTPALRETCADAAIYVDPFDPKSVSAGLGQILSDASLRQTLSQKSIAHAAQFTPERQRFALQRAYDAVTSKGSDSDSSRKSLHRSDVQPS